MRTLWRIIAGFFKWTWRLLNFVRNLVMNIFFIFLVLVCAGIWMHISNANQAQHSTRGALLLDITGVIVDKPSASNRLGAISRQLFGATSDRLQENSLFDIVDTIRQAKDDRNITGIVLDLKDFAGGDQPSMQYIGKALREFRDSGKPVIAVGDSYSQGNITWRASPIRSGSPHRARSICTGLPPTACTINPCSTSLRLPPTSSASARINQPSSRLSATTCLQPPVKRTAAGLASCGRTISAPLPPTARLRLSRRSRAHRACWMACVRLTVIPQNMRSITNWLMPWHQRRD